MIPNVLGIDPSSVAVGWALLREGRYAESGVMRSDHGEFEERRRSIRSQAAELFGRLTTEGDIVIDVVAVEDCMSPRNIGTSKVLRTIGAMVEEIATGVGLPYLSVRPAEWQAEAKSVLDVQGLVAPKELSMRAAIMDTGVETLSEDEADAYFIAKFVSRVGVSNKVAG